MIWNYKCPICGQWRNCDWNERNNIKNCHIYKKDYNVPTPAQQNDAYVDTHNWPVEMEDVVIASKGSKCSAPDCVKDYETLDHRIPYSNGGRTSVDNLFPMCNECNQSKGDKNFLQWILGY
jgi:5-methylcytosine-specific restriction endonuclease McrA